MAVGLTGVAVLSFVLAAALGPDNPSFWLRLAYIVAVLSGVALLLAALVQWARTRIEHLLADRLLDLASPSLIRSMPPRTVLARLLPWIYGDSTDHEDVLTGVLGGPGRDIDGGDTAVSRNTTAHFRIWTVSDGVCASEAEWTHELTGVRRNHKFVVFATHDEEIGTMVARERRFPLFESYRVLDEDELDDFIRRIREQIRLGITYSDTTGRSRRVAPRTLDGEIVPLRQFDHYVALPAKVDPQDLCIVQFDLWDLVDDDHVASTIDSITVHAIGTPGADLGWYSWSVPHPCFVRTIRFDVAELHPADGRYEYLAVTFALRHVPINLRRWTTVDDCLELDLNSWMLPGHGVTLLWRSTAE